MAITKKSRPKQFPDKENYNQRLPQLPIDVSRLNSMIYNQGVKVKVYKTMICPNRKSIDGAEHQIDCPLCYGNELVDVDPIETYAIIEGIQSEELWNPNNVGTTWQEQTVRMTFISGIELFYFTKVELIDFTMQFRELVQRQQGNTDVTKYPIYSVDVLMDKNGTRYYLGTDFVIEHNNIKWKMGGGAHRPTRGTIYSVYYNTYVVFRALNALHSNRFGTDGVKKPEIENVEYQQQWICKKDYLISREDINGNPLDKNKIFPPE